jgi:hypothetical protein
MTLARRTKNEQQQDGTQSRSTVRARLLTTPAMQRLLPVHPSQLPTPDTSPPIDHTMAHRPSHRPSIHNANSH